jgi:hypothetical protein
MRDDDRCANCGNVNFEMDHSVADIICTTCGLVVPHSNLYDYFASAPKPDTLHEKPHRHHAKPRISVEVRQILDREKSAKYQHITYVRELFRLVQGREPIIPDEDFGLIEAVCRRRYARGATKDELRGALHDIDVFKKKLGERGYFVQKYLVRHLGLCVHATL